MTDLLYAIDVALFFFINHTIANPVLDLVLPWLTDLNKQRPVLALLLVFIVYLLWKGDKRTRTTIGLLIVTIIIGDQVNSSILKEFFGRIRPCRALEGVRMLVDCGGGLSFPSSHAVNNFAAASVIGHYFRKQRPYWLAYASVIALSRPYVGVHYPSDVVAGAVLGSLLGLAIVSAWDRLSPVLHSKFIQRGN